MDRRDLLVRSGALATSVLAGCTGTGREPTGSDRRASPSEPTTDDPTDTPQTSTTETAVIDEERLATLAADNAAFALDLHRHLADRQGGNLFLSPYSVSAALAMVYAGARGKTRRQMADVLHYALGDEIHPAFADLRTVLESRATAEAPVGDGTVDAFRLSVANALWGQAGFPFADDYLGLLEAHYRTGLRTADFDDRPAAERERINEWVAESTGGRIDTLLPRGSIDPSTVLVLTNAIYFMAGWRFEFDPEKTEEATFTALDGSNSTVSMMRQHLETTYASVPGAEAVELPYVGNEVSMVLLLPEEGRFASFERDLDADRLFAVFEDLRSASGEVRLPRFEYGTNVRLSAALSTLGMPVAFGGSADFGGIVETGDGPFLDEVYHQAAVSVDEEGTEAAAATAAVMAESAPARSFDLTFDRPFVFCIRDRPTNAVLFLGRVVDGRAFP